MTTAGMDVDHPAPADAALDRAYDVLERLRDCGLAPSDFTDESALLSARDDPPVLAAAAALASALSSVPWPQVGTAGGCDPSWGWILPQEQTLQAAATAVKACCDGQAGGGGLDSALAGLLAAVDPVGAGYTASSRVEILGT